MAAAAFHQLVWIDHRSAHIHGLQHGEIVELAAIHAPDQNRGHIHHKAGNMGAGHTSPSPEFLKDVTVALEEAGAILIVGPADAKHALKDFMAAHAPRQDRRVIGVVPLDKGDPAKLTELAKTMFRRADQMRAPHF
jgi:hypothetical protein